MAKGAKSKEQNVEPLNLWVLPLGMGGTPNMVGLLPLSWRG
jgi:hypothetical protein